MTNTILTIKDKNEITKKKICFTLKQRTETIVYIPIAELDIENKNILINKQQLSENVYCTNMYNIIKNSKIIVNVLNISEIQQDVNRSDS